MSIKSAIASLFIALTLFSGVARSEYSFVVHNNTKQKIVQILTSEDKKNWGEFDIGSGIRAGESVTLVWAAHTDTGACKNYFTAVFADGSESQPTLHDFCAAALELEFD